ncbi:hypothetical protein DSM112329_04138 [Paraconexibacter sp. AEG42_29]|uniref:Nuclease SbcCD subunit C n=1 Tax=Paraconexibacter sp. AEG42_29 TaxID=2997339 RepID=A0AAU7AZV0_9ACTN
MDPTLHALLLERLAASDLPAAAQDAVVEAAGPPATAPPEGPEDAAGPSPATLRGPAREVYLRSISVEGFRGIGPPATLALDAQPGLTIVVGRNGSGKSSFAEGLELLTTGVTKRWEDRTKGWTSTWQCLHHDGPTRLRAEFVVAGDADMVVLEQTWEPGVAYTDASGRGPVAGALAARGWDAALGSFRPFLSYAELASMFDKLTSLPAALSPILGLEDVDGVQERLAQERLAIAAEVKALKAQADTLVARLDPGDPRQAELGDLLAVRRPDADAVRAHLDAARAADVPAASGPETAELRRVAAQSVPDDEAITAAHAAVARTARAARKAATTSAARDLATADLLARALAIRDPSRLTDDCPVCGTVGVLDPAWADQAAGAVQALRAQAAELQSATRAAEAAAREWQALAARLLPAAAGDAAPAGPGAAAGDDATARPAAVLAAAAAIRAAADEARARLDAQDGAWRAVADAAGAWLELAARVQPLAPRHTALQAAEKWLKAEADTLRNARFAPIAQQAVANWEVLRHDSNVELHDITLRSVGRRREATFDVRADGETANALGVMSQGELLALSVSVFLPRAGLDESPFRFAVIDDPVQSMDPAKVDGLARVLSRNARARQVVVFTHDDRLPEAIRRLRLPATVLQVNRRSRSQVSVATSQTPLLRHLKDARHMALTERIPDEVRQRVVPTLCRGAIEAACAELVRRRVVTDGLHASAADDALADARTLRDHLALALLGDATTHEGLTDVLRTRAGADGPMLVSALNQAVHEAHPGSTLQLQERTSRLVHALMETP